MVFIQSIINLCREFDEEEREIWLQKKASSTTDQVN